MGDIKHNISVQKQVARAERKWFKIHTP